jgi:regulator of RNase E activity RraA
LAITLTRSNPAAWWWLDNGGRENATVWGDILTFVAHQRRCRRTVIDGACRDTHLSRVLGYPIFSRSYSMRTGKDRVQVEAVNSPVNIGDARVHPGDVMRGDADGVLVIPLAHEERCAHGRRGDRRHRAADPRRHQDGKNLAELVVSSGTSATEPAANR